MEDQELLEVLEKAYAKGVPLDYIRTVTSDEQYKAAEEFFLKKRLYRRIVGRSSFGFRIRIGSKYYGISFFSSKQ